MTARAAAVTLLSVAVFASALAQVWVVHQARKDFTELQRLRTERDDMNVEWSRLQIEQGAWATHSRIERLASSQLGMQIPDPEVVVIIRK